MFQCLMIYLDLGPPLPHKLQIPQGFDLIYDGNRYIMEGTLVLALTISETVRLVQVWNSLGSQ